MPRVWRMSWKKTSVATSGRLRAVWMMREAVATRLEGSAARSRQYSSIPAATRTARSAASRGIRRRGTVRGSAE